VDPWTHRHCPIAQCQQVPLTGALFIKVQGKRCDFATVFPLHFILEKKELVDRAGLRNNPARNPVARWAQSHHHYLIWPDLHKANRLMNAWSNI